MEDQTLIDERPRIKTAIFEGDKVFIMRKNLTTGKMFRITIESQLFLDYQRSGRDKKMLQKALLPKETIDFIHLNKIDGEVSVRK
jgi:hypothetical protein